METSPVSDQANREILFWVASRGQPCGYRWHLAGLYVAQCNHHRAGSDLAKLAPHVFLIGAKHPKFTTLRFAKGSIVIDPWRYLAPQDGVTVIPVGARCRRAAVTCPISRV